MASNCEYKTVFIAIIFEIDINVDMNNEYKYQNLMWKINSLTSITMTVDQ